MNTVVRMERAVGPRAHLTATAEYKLVGGERQVACAAAAPTCWVTEDAPHGDARCERPRRYVGPKTRALTQVSPNRT